jgi:hypothetical protein
MRKVTIHRKWPSLTNETFTFNLDAYDKDDIITDTILPYQGIRKSFDQILRPKLKHISSNKTRRPKNRVIIGMVKLIFRVSLKIFMRELLEGNAVEMPDVGYMQMRTSKFNNAYRGRDRQKQKEADRSDAPLIWPIQQKYARKEDKVVYFAWLHGLSARRHEELVKKGKTYNQQEIL